ncbi:MAG: tyrosine-protein phosphatase [Pseudomonadota bacterium]
MSSILSGASNFRDLRGDLKSHPALRAGTLYRSDHLGALDANDARQIQALGIRRVLDFRGATERESAACAVPGVEVHSLAIEPTIVQVIKEMISQGHSLTEDDVVAQMQDTYRGFVRGNSHRFAEFFGHLLESNEPTVFHCTAGKDRTGFAAALILHALGVPKDEVMRDYLLTNERLRPFSLEGWTLPGHVVQVIWRVQPEFLDAAYQAIDADFGSIEGYLREGVELGPAERERLRELYLTRA